jgi:flavodoxin
MAGAVVYYSTYGSTRQYAEWIAEETGFALYDQKSDSIPWETVDRVVIGSPTLVMQPFLKGWIAEMWDVLKDKKVFLYSTSGAEPTNPALQAGFKAAFPSEIAEKIDYTPLHGRMIFKKLKPMHRLMMRIGKMIEKNPDRKAEMLKDVDGVDRASISPLVAKVVAAG